MNLTPIGQLRIQLLTAITVVVSSTGNAMRDTRALTYC